MDIDNTDTHECMVARLELLAAGMGKQPKPNTLLAMTKEIIEENKSLKDTLDFLNKQLP